MRQCVPLLEWVMYFAPALFFAYIAALCTALILTSLFLVHVRNPRRSQTPKSSAAPDRRPRSVAARAQLNDLRDTRLATQADAQSNYAAVLESIHAAGWIITRRVGGRLASELWRVGRRAIGFSLVARKRCRHDKGLIKAAVCVAI